MTIYLLKNSQHNEDFFLDGYATNDEEIVYIMRKWVEEFFYAPPTTTIEVDYHSMVVWARWEDNEFMLYLRPINRIDLTSKEYVI